MRLPRDFQSLAATGVGMRLPRDFLALAATGVGMRLPRDFLALALRAVLRTFKFCCPAKFAEPSTRVLITLYAMMTIPRCDILIMAGERGITRAILGARPTGRAAHVQILLSCKICRTLYSGSHHSICHDDNTTL